IDDILAEEDHESARGATEVLVAYLHSQGGEAAASSCAAHMKSKGFGGTTQRSAKKRAGVVSRKASYDGQWTWCLPDSDEGVQDVQEVRDVQEVQEVRETPWTSSKAYASSLLETPPLGHLGHVGHLGEDDQGVQDVQGVQSVGPSVRAPVREDGPLVA